MRGLEKLWGLAIRDVDEVEDNILSALAGDEESTQHPSLVKPLGLCANICTPWELGDMELITMPQSTERPTSRLSWMSPRRFEAPKPTWRIHNLC